MQARNGWVRQAGQHADLAQKTLWQFASGAVGAEQLHRLGALRDDVPHLVHLADAAGAQRAKHFVITDDVARFNWHGCPKNGPQPRSDWKLSLTPRSILRGEVMDCK